MTLWCSVLRRWVDLDLLAGLHLVKGKAVYADMVASLREHVYKPQ